MSDPALQSLIDAWLRARPEWIVAMPFLHGNDRDVLAALACLEQQWIESVYGIGESAVAVAKLSWWLEELDVARRGEARHPLSKTLFADGRAQALDAACWSAPIEAGLRLRDAPPSADFAAQMALTEPFHAGLAVLENGIWFGPDAPSARAQRHATLTHLLDLLGRLETPPHAGASALPMNLLARHNLSASDLGKDSPGRRAALHDQLDAMAQAWQAGEELPGPLSVFRSLSARADRAQLRRAQRASDPAAVLATGVPAAGSAAVFSAWRAARRWRGWINRQRAPT